MQRIYSCTCKYTYRCIWLQIWGTLEWNVPTFIYILNFFRRNYIYVCCILWFMYLLTFMTYFFSRYETVTQTDVENTRHQIRPPIMNMSSSEVIHDLKDQAKNDHTLSSSDAEEHTNGIPHIPNYWTPTHHLKNVISKCIKLNYYFRLRWKFFPSNRFEFK